MTHRAGIRANCNGNNSTYAVLTSLIANGEVIAVCGHPRALKPSYLMWLEWTDGWISFIRDYRHVSLRRHRRGASPGARRRASGRRDRSRMNRAPRPSRWAAATAQAQPLQRDPMPQDYGSTTGAAEKVGAAIARREPSLFAASHIASDGSVIAKETEHFPGRVRPSRIGIGSGGTAARPSVASSMDAPLL
jgi:hypothetical protein